jgi:hypothetical protein
MMYTIKYPSGRTFTAAGQFRLVPVPNMTGLHPSIWEDEPSMNVIMIDPRGVVTDEAGWCAYNGATQNTTGLK